MYCRKHAGAKYAKQRYRAKLKPAAAPTANPIVLYMEAMALRDQGLSDDEIITRLGLS